MKPKKLLLLILLLFSLFEGLIIGVNANSSRLVEGDFNYLDVDIEKYESWHSAIFNNRTSSDINMEANYISELYVYDMENIKYYTGRLEFIYVIKSGYLLSVDVKYDDITLFSINADTLPVNLIIDFLDIYKSNIKVHIFSDYWSGGANLFEMPSFYKGLILSIANDSSICVKASQVDYDDAILRGSGMTDWKGNPAKDITILDKEIMSDNVCLYYLEGHTSEYIVRQRLFVNILDSIPYYLYDTEIALKDRISKEEYISSALEAYGEYEIYDIYSKYFDYELNKASYEVIITILAEEKLIMLASVIYITDTDPPIIRAPSVIASSIDRLYSLEDIKGFVSVLDDSSYDLTLIDKDSYIESNTPGVYEIEVEAIDSEGNTASTSLYYRVGYSRSDKLSFYTTKAEELSRTDIKDALISKGYIRESDYVELSSLYFDNPYQEGEYELTVNYGDLEAKYEIVVYGIQKQEAIAEADNNIYLIIGIIIGSILILGVLWILIRKGMKKRK